MITLYDEQVPFDAHNTINTSELKKKEDNYQLKKSECINDERFRPSQVDINKRIQQVKENYFLERRSFL